MNDSINQDSQADQFSRRNFLRKSAEVAGAVVITPSLLTMSGALSETAEAAPIKRMHSDLVRLEIPK